MKRRPIVAALALLVAGTAHGYPIAEERKLGDRFALEAAAALPLVREPAVLDYVGRIGQRMVERLEAPQPFEYRFSVVQNGTLNAFAVPGGFVYVNSGILLRAANESEFAGVLGHEIAHSHAHHIVRQQEQSELLNYAALAGMLLSILHPAIGAAAMGVNATVQLKYQRQFEQEADYLGVRYMRAAGYDPHGMTRFMKRLSDEQRTLPLDEIPPYMLSHPLTDERISNLEAVTKDIAAKSGWQRPTFALERAQTIVRVLGGDRTVRDRYGKLSAAGDRALALYGVVLLYGGDATAAAAVLEKARGPGFEEIDDDLALARFRSGDVEGARRVLRARLEVAPDDAVARGLLGELLVASQDYDAAVKELERAVRAAPELDQAEYDLGQAYGRSGHAALGVYHLARSLEMRGDIDSAIAQYEKATKTLPVDSPEADTAKQRLEMLREVSHRHVAAP